MQKANAMSSWWTPEEEQDFRSMEHILLILSTVGIGSATDFYVDFQDSFLDKFICSDCENYKDSCSCDDFRYTGRYSREYDDE